MGEQTFEFLKQVINERSIGDIVTRAEIIAMLIQMYKPSPKDQANASLRSGTSQVFNELIIRGTLERIGRGKYKILKYIPYLLNYKDFRKIPLNEN